MAELMVLETKERRREWARLLDEAMAAGVWPDRDELERYQLDNANPLHRDYDAVLHAREWSPGTGRCVYVWGPDYTVDKMGYALLDRALLELYSVVACDTRDVMNKDIAPSELQTAAVLLMHWIDSPFWGHPELLDPVINLLSVRRDAGRVTIVTAGVSPERFVEADSATEIQAAQAAVMNLFNTAAGGPLVLHLQG